MLEPVQKHIQKPPKKTSEALYGDYLLYLQRQFPRFNFYDDKPDTVSANIYLQVNKPVEFELYRHYGEVKRWFLGVINDAQESIWKQDYDTAIFYLEYLIEQRYIHRKPYDMLIGLYKKQKNVSAEIQTLERSINFFRELKAYQGAQIMELAAWYNITNYILDQGTDKKIEYYGGAFVLYDPMKFLEKWEDRLNNLNKNI